MRIKTLCVAGARPNFMKIAPLLRAMTSRKAFDAKLVHTGQHYDPLLSKVFFDDLQIPKPDIQLEVGSGSHAAQTAEIMKRFEPVLQAEQPHVVLVVGDVNSTIGCALPAAKFRLDAAFQTLEGSRVRPLIVHVEAGLRSFDDNMPEEINRKLTDAISDLLYVSDPAGIQNLRAEGVCAERVIYVGNVMIDTLLAAKRKAQRSTVLGQLGLEPKQYGVVTLHRPSNVDRPDKLRETLKALDRIAQDVRLVFPVHPRTRNRINAAGGVPQTAPDNSPGPTSAAKAGWVLSDPVGYFDFITLLANAKVVLTDSGGIQEETTVLGVPCVTLRENTERPVTVEQGTNVMAGTQPEAIWAAYDQAISQPVTGRVPKYWDGSAATRIADHLQSLFR